MLTDLGLTPRVDFVPGSMLVYDFDNGNAANDGFGVLYGIHDLGVGDGEVNSAPGDSGSPTFIFLPQEDPRFIGGVNCGRYLSSRRILSLNILL